MAIYDLFSKRQKKLRGEDPDVYRYDDIPPSLRTQIIHILHDTLGNEEEYYKDQVKDAYKFIVETLCREYGLLHLLPPDSYSGRNYIEELEHFILKEVDVERVLDAIELSTKVIDAHTREWDYLRRHRASECADDAISELNTRFNEHGVGYQYADKGIIRIDSELVHGEIVKPAIQLLRREEYAGAQEEYLKAYEHYRHGNAKEALNECLKAFESVMKAICDKRGWAYPKTATAKPLIQICLDQKLIPQFWQHHFSSLKSLLESGIPTGRNKMSGHGQGSKIKSVPAHVVAYMLHMTASAIVFLAHAESDQE